MSDELLSVNDIKDKINRPETLFMINQKVEAKIDAMIGQLGDGWMVEYQGDPRGNTVKVSYQGRWIRLNV